MRKNNWSYLYTRDFVKEKRSYINPNPSFVKQLEKLEKIYVNRS